MNPPPYKGSPWDRFGCRIPAPPEVTYRVVHEDVGGTHVFWSADPAAAGLCVAGRDLAKAYSDVAVQLGMLLGRTWIVPEVPLGVFAAYLAGSGAAPDGVVPAAVLGWRGPGKAPRPREGSPPPPDPVAAP